MKVTPAAAVPLSSDRRSHCAIVELSSPSRQPSRAGRVVTIACYEQAVPGRSAGTKVARPGTRPRQDAQGKPDLKNLRARPLGPANHAGAIARSPSPGLLESLGAHAARQGAAQKRAAALCTIVIAASPPQDHRRSQPMLVM